MEHEKGDNGHVMKSIGKGWQYTTYDIGGGRVRKVFNSPLASYLRMLYDSAPYVSSPPWKYPGFYRRTKSEAESSVLVVTRTEAPKWMLGNPVYTGGLDYEQDRLRPLKNVLGSVDDTEGKRIIDSFVSFIRTLLGYSLIDRGFTIGTNFSLDAQGRVVLSDLGELYDDPKDIARIISERPWAKAHVLYPIPDNLRTYFVSEMDRAFAPEASHVAPLAPLPAMKILWVVSSGWKEGGVENLIVVARERLEAKGHQVKVFSSDARPDMPHFSDYEFETPSGVMRPFRYSWNGSAYQALRGAISDFSPDIIHVHTVGHASPAILFAFGGTPAVLTVHGPEGFVKSLITMCQPGSDFRNETFKKRDLTPKGWLRYCYHRYVNRLLYVVGFKNFSTILTPSRYMHTLVERDGMKNLILPNGTELFKKAPLPIGHRPRTIAFAGRLETYKGVDVLIRAFVEVLKKHPDAHLRIAGDGSQREQLIQLAHALGVSDKAEFVGHLGRAELQSFYAASDICVMPSTWIEAFGLSGVEAMSVARPIVASHVGGIPDWLVDGDCGYIVTPGDSNDLANALDRILSDTELFHRMCERAYLQAQHFSLDAHIDALLSVYASVVRGR